MTAPVNDATLRQNRASDPEMSVWLSANAGSGKTRVLTDRVARLLLDGADPQSILCLTYTKAAASEMQNRLFKRLGAWAMLPDERLRQELQQVGLPGSPDLPTARRLFARAIETPGGLRIQTIHSFCASILRRFPIEAGVSPRFTEIDDSAQRHLIGELLDRLGRDNPDVLRAIGRQYSGDDVGALASRILTDRDAVPETPALAQALAAFDLPEDADDSLPIRTAFQGLPHDLLSQVATICARHSKTMVDLAQTLRRIDTRDPGWTDLHLCYAAFLKRKDGVFLAEAKTASIPTAKAAKDLGPLLPQLHDLMTRVAAARDQELALDAAHQTLVLHGFARAVLDAYEAEKARRGFLDFDDLIRRTEALLSDPIRAAWVLYRLDGGISHVLVDEAQDTSPVQWRVIDRLTQEFGQNDDAHRTLFVVGDRKQSIYSFQGADPQEFNRQHDAFRQRLIRGAGLTRLDLDYSFRSSQAILHAVDCTFQGDAATAIGHDTAHLAFHQDLPGRVDLWPIIPKAPQDKDGDWTDPVDRISEHHEDVELARTIAAEIWTLIHEETIPCDNGKSRRPVTPGDVLILVRGRGGVLFHELIRACKQAGLPVAGADRLKIGGELAVRDLTALLKFLALPEDDLSLATILRSPLFGWSEDALFRLAHGRGPRPLWAALRDARFDHPDTLAVLDDLRGKADFLRPFDLLERALTRHDLRRLLLARLGAEAEDGIDALLSQALAYETGQVPSLTGFLIWLDTEDVEIKRQLDAGGDRIRVMTVHGAKGLESPIVILPDTLGGKRSDTSSVVLDDAGHLLWSGRAAEQPNQVSVARRARTEAEDRERQRLLYVAMTRAESWLIVCGAGNVDHDGIGWHAQIESGLIRADADPLDAPTGTGLRVARGNWNGAPLNERPEPRADLQDLPDWAQRPAPPEPDVPAPLSPSDMGGAKALPGDPGLTDEARSLARGTMIHTLLEHLPTVPAADRQTLAESLRDTAEVTLSDADFAQILAETETLLARPDLAPIFAPDTLAEVELTAALPELGGGSIAGNVDRIILSPGHVRVVDYKSNALVPERPEDTPVGLLRQLGAYRSALTRIYPDHHVDTAILWTRTGHLMVYDNKIVMEALQNRATS
jgi:ATP-dependent helicase/nuclease subunit A